MVCRSQCCSVARNSLTGDQDSVAAISLAHSVSKHPYLFRTHPDVPILTFTKERSIEEPQPVSGSEVWKKYVDFSGDGVVNDICYGRENAWHRTEHRCGGLFQCISANLSRRAI